jgi:hypothetical protein
MIKALLIVATLTDPIGYESLEVCDEVAKRLNNVQGQRVAMCIPAGVTKQDRIFEKFLEMITKLQKQSVDKSE